MRSFINGCLSDDWAGQVTLHPKTTQYVCVFMYVYMCIHIHTCVHVGIFKYTDTL